MRRLLAALTLVVAFLLLGVSHVRLLDPGRLPQIVPAFGELAAFALMLVGWTFIGMRRLLSIVVVGAIAVPLVLFYLSWWHVVPDSVMYLLQPSISLCRAVSATPLLCCNYDEVGHPLGWVIGFGATGLVAAALLAAVRAAFGRVRSTPGAV